MSDTPEAFQPASATELAAKRSGAMGPRDVEAAYDIPVQVSAVLGRATMQV